MKRKSGSPFGGCCLILLLGLLVTAGLSSLLNGCQSPSAHRYLSKQLANVFLFFLFWAVVYLLYSKDE